VLVSERWSREIEDILIESSPYLLVISEEVFKVIRVIAVIRVIRGITEIRVFAVIRIISN
jgi:hypothetical protein